jgi:hypothetical protein
MSEGKIRPQRLDGCALNSMRSIFNCLGVCSTDPGLDSSRKAAQMLCQALGLQRLNTVEVLHRTKAFGLVVTHQDGWRLV